MNEYERLEQQRRETVRRMLVIGPIRKGTISEQYVPVVKAGQPTRAKRGPYWILTTKKNGKTVSVRLRTPEAIARAREAIANQHELARLFHEFEELTERQGVLERETGASEEALKKGLKSRSNRARTSRG